ncbi:Retrovirus-related Pol polyprotein from transposon TNT 1-94 [Dendrobium catenatum]|uniref:Retrovirus-related Pol polyprotein from transposon TNT 1-94 n=1 Tax=Dendrobium catenatum TaxID=906689 RepID=A0A2I0W1Z8_9ASPA|nr:Retrovirus-related Pol polyprotein from transposon TNT 1-94 [Dendrobium catenatum]
MYQEIFALQKQGTWSLVAPPPNASILGCKWTYRTKHHADGSIARFKARLVAQGNHQEYGINYTETFSPVAKLPTIRILLTIALHHSWPVHQLDVENAFLHGNLTETIYMIQPKGFEDKTKPNHVCLLHKAIYGLKQAPRQWYNMFTSSLQSLGFTHSKSDPSLLIFRKNSTQIYILVYVDDILITGNNDTEISALIKQLNKSYALKHLGPVHNFLGIKIQSGSNRYFLSQPNYANSILQLAGHTNCKPTANPACTKLPLTIASDPLLSDYALFRRIIGSLQYLTLTRPDISFSVNLLSQHMHNPLPTHIHLLKQLLRYIQGTQHFGIPITKGNLSICSFSDADWAEDPVSRKSTSGYWSFIGDNIISWKVQKQHTVARSSTEAEYRSLAALTADIIWLRQALLDFGIQPDQPAELYCDNMSAIAIANNPVFHARTKHIEIDQRFVRDHIQKNNIKILPVSTIDQIADVLTKPLSTKRFRQLRTKLTVLPDPSVCGGVLE